MRVLKTELLSLAVNASPHMNDLRELLESEQQEQIITDLNHAFNLLVGSGDLASEELSIDDNGRFDSVLYGKSSGNTVIAYNFSGLSSDAMIPLFSAAIAFFTNTIGPGSTGDALNTVVAFWHNLAVLRAPDDSDAITVIRAAIAVRTQKSNFVHDHLPAMREISQETGFEEERTVTALRALAERKVMSVAVWGGQKGDLSDPANRWTFPL